MTTQGLMIGLAGLVVVLGAWTYFSSNGAPWHQSQQQGQQGGQQRGKQQGQRQRSQQRGQQNQQQSGQDQDEDEVEGNPEDWTEEDLKTWLENRSETVDGDAETRVMLLARVQEMRR